MNNKQVVIGTYEATEQPIRPTNQCVVMIKPIVNDITEQPIKPTNQCTIM